MPLVTCSPHDVPHLAPGLRRLVVRLAWAGSIATWQQRGRATAAGAAPRQRSTSVAVSYHITLYFIAHCVTGII